MPSPSGAEPNRGEEGLPGWLTTGYPAIEALAFAIRREVEYPSRPKLRARLVAIKNAALLLANAAPDLQINPLLFPNGGGWISNETYHELCDIATRAERVLAGAPPRQGRGQLYPKPTLGPNARELCALIVSMQWKKAHGRFPGRENPEALELCRELWKTAGGSPPATGTWSTYLKRAQQYRPPHPAGELIKGEQKEG
jgi:hypothetical protein